MEKREFNVLRFPSGRALVGYLSRKERLDLSAVITRRYHVTTIIGRDSGLRRPVICNYLSDANHTILPYWDWFTSGGEQRGQKIILSRSKDQKSTTHTAQIIFDHGQKEEGRPPGRKG